jgi:hypothetical protein
MTYTELQAQIAAYLHRTDLAARIPGFIALAEAYLFRELQIRETQIVTTITTTDDYAPLPADFSSLSRITMTHGSVEYALDYQSDPQAASDPAPGRYALETGRIRIYGAGTGAVATMYYVPKPPALSALQPSNWLLEAAPDLYLYASALEGAKYTRDTAEAANLAGLVQGAMDAVRRYIETRGRPAVGSMQIKVRR